MNVCVIIIIIGIGTGDGDGDSCTWDFVQRGVRWFACFFLLLASPLVLARSLSLRMEGWLARVEEEKKEEENE